MAKQAHFSQHNQIIGHATVSVKFSRYLFFSTTYEATLFRYTGNGYNFKIYAIVRDKGKDKIVGTVDEENPVAGGKYNLNSVLPHQSYLDAILVAYHHLKQANEFKDKEPLT